MISAKNIALIVGLFIASAHLYCTENTRTPEEIHGYYLNLINEAQDQNDLGEIDNARTLYNEIITTQEDIPTQLRNSARLKLAQMLLYGSPKRPNEEETVYILGLLNDIVESPLNQVDINDWAQAHLILADLLLAHIDTLKLQSPEHYHANLDSAMGDYVSVLEQRHNLKPWIVYTAAVRCIELVYNHPILTQNMRSKLNFMLAYRYMVDAYNNLSDEEKGDSTIPGIFELNTIRIHYIQQLIKDADYTQARKVLNTIITAQDPSVDQATKNKARLLLAETFTIQSKYTQARQILNYIITTQNPEVDQPTKNRARVILADMNLHGEGLPNNAPDIPAAKELYKTVVEQAEINIMENDKNKAELALKFINRKKI